MMKKFLFAFLLILNSASFATQYENFSKEYGLVSGPMKGRKPVFVRIQLLEENWEEWYERSTRIKAERQKRQNPEMLEKALQTMAAQNGVAEIIATNAVKIAMGETKNTYEEIIKDAILLIADSALQLHRTSDGVKSFLRKVGAREVILRNLETQLDGKAFCNDIRNIFSETQPVVLEKEEKFYSLEELERNASVRISLKEGVFRATATVKAEEVEHFKEAVCGTGAAHSLAARVKRELLNDLSKKIEAANSDSSGSFLVECSFPYDLMDYIQPEKSRKIVRADGQADAVRTNNHETEDDR